MTNLSDLLKNRAAFWEANENRASISKRTFYKRVASGEFNSLEEALTAPKYSREGRDEDTETTSSVPTLDELNSLSVNEVFNSNSEDEDETEEDYGYDYDEDEDELSFGSSRVKAPRGA